MKASFGTITSLQNQIAQVRFTGKMPPIYSLLTLAENPEILLEVFQITAKNTVECLILTHSEAIQLGAVVSLTNQMSTIPVGKEVLGRVLNGLGHPEDGKPFTPQQTRELHSPETYAVSIQDTRVPQEILETGIKALDFFAPILRGGKIGLFGGAGLGKTILLTELMQSIVIRNKSEKKQRVAVFTAVGERIREAQELIFDLEKAGVLEKTSIIMGQMGENPAMRFRAAAAGVTVAEYFRDEGHADVLFFMDNMYRYAQAGYEIATQQKMIPSEDGYQPNLPTQIGTLHQRLTSTHAHSITTIEAVYLPSDDITDYSVRSIMPYLDSIVVLSREIYQEGRLPAVDILHSSSSALQPDIVSPQHYETYREARQLLAHAEQLERIVSLVGMNELSPENRSLYQRSLLLKNYMTQPFGVVEKQSGTPGEYVPLETTINDVQKILAGKYDSTDPDSLRMQGSLS